MSKHPGEHSLDDDTRPAKKPALTVTPKFNLSSTSCIPEDQDRVPYPVFTAWSAPFIGTAHEALANNIRNMYQTRHIDRRYGSHASIIQSSGSGKSRLVHEVADKMFTIPFNIRGPRDAASGPWPPADDEIRRLLVQGPIIYKDESSLYAHYLCFFAALFEETRKTVEQCFSQTPRAELASIWRGYLANKNNRAALYAKVVDSASTKAREKEIGRSLDRYETHASLRGAAQRALDKLVRVVCAEPDCSSHNSYIEKVHVLIYFDAAHVLAKPVNQFDSSHSDKGNVALDVLFGVLDELPLRGLFTVFLSSQPNVEPFAPSDSTPFSSSARGRILTENTNAPITETPFDCFGPLPIIPSRLYARDVGHVAFMACFGRPLWRTLLLEFTDQVVERCTNPSASDTPQVPAPSSNSECAALIALARSKLLCDSSVLAGERKRYSRAAQTAVLDVRIMLRFDPRRSAARLRERELVASHMRMVYSIPRDCEYLRSGYSSEPILAEAAAHQLHAWRVVENADVAVAILERDFDDDLLDRGEIRETVGRLLLILARDRAVLTTLPDNEIRTVFSRAVPVNAFIKELFPPDIAQKVLASVPDNLPASNTPEARRTFEDAFKDAVLNFTHFTEWGDYSPPDGDAALGCFLRSMAVICRTKGAIVDAFLPVVIRQSERLSPEGMSGILIQFKLRKAGGTQAAYEVDEKDLALFRTTPPLADSDGETPLRPYISLFMELGANRLPEPLRADSPVDVGPGSGPAAMPTQPFDQSQQPVDNLDACAPGPAAQSSPPDVDLGVTAAVHEPDPTPSRAVGDAARIVQEVHPRYSMYAYGCSPSVYRVASRSARLYRKLVRSGDVLAEHTAHKPFFCGGDASWHWLANDRLNAGGAGLQSDSSESAAGGDSAPGGLVVLSAPGGRARVRGGESGI
ncbi:hypothetical protein LXA43DRAFT_1008973 [Ganoderma leucocontextum]|nr:hypothetical protein LXA43DRAFT_1008973 [Ganoderma leucocontextum]